jgi:hypothetical protein
MYSTLIAIILVVAAAYVVGVAVAYADPLMRPFAIILVVAIAVGLWLRIEFLAKKMRLAEEKLLIVRDLLLDVAFLECRCSDNAVIIEAPMEPEKVGKPLEKGYCEVCRARAILEEHYPGAIEERERDRYRRYPKLTQK